MCAGRGKRVHIAGEEKFFKYVFPCYIRIGKMAVHVLHVEKLVVDIYVFLFYRGVLMELVHYLLARSCIFTSCSRH